MQELRSENAVVLAQMAARIREIQLATAVRQEELNRLRAAREERERQQKENEAEDKNDKASCNQKNFETKLG